MTGIMGFARVMNPFFFYAVFFLQKSSFDILAFYSLQSDSVYVFMVKRLIE